MNYSKIFTIAFAVAVSCLVSKSEAQLSYEFRFGASNYDVTPGSTVDIDFFLRETVSGGADSVLQPGNDDGLGSYGLNIDFSSIAGVGTGSTIACATDVVINTIFVDFIANDVTLLASSADVAGVTTDPNGEDGTLVSANIYEILLGTVTVTAGDEGTVTTFALSDHTDTATVFSTLIDDSNFIDIDATASYGSTTISVVAIPEPAAAVILVGLAGFAAVRRRR